MKSHRSSRASTFNFEFFSLLHIYCFLIIDFYRAAFPLAKIFREAKLSNISLFPIVIAEDVRNNGTLRSHRLARSRCIIHRSRDITVPSIVAETLRRSIPFPKSLLREIVIRDERRDNEEAARDNRNRTEPDWDRCHRRFAFKAGGPTLSPGTSVWPARIRSPAGRPNARRALALFITNSQIPNSKWTSVQVSFVLLLLSLLLFHPRPLPPLYRFILLLVFFQLRFSCFISLLPSLNLERIQAICAYLQWWNGTNYFMFVVQVYQTC